ncbi:MAG TPA: NAD-dependent epimerase/dehydratase family protein [Candidatus Paceibacterota bacterium]
MNILVTGGAGFIGANLCRALRTRGDTVVVIDNLSVSERNVPLLDEIDTQLVRADIADYDAIEPHFAGIDIVFHLAAMNRAQRSIENPRAANAANITGTLNVLEAMRTHKVPRVVFTSSSSVYGGRTGALKESDALSPPHPYGVGKLAGEHYVRVYGELFGLKWTTLRLFSVYGPLQLGDIDKAGAVAKFVHLANMGKPLPLYGDGSTMRNFTYVDDVVRCLVLASESSSALGHVINVANIREVPIKNLADAVLRVVDSSAGAVNEPSLAGDPPRNQPDTSAAKQLLGYEAEIDLEEGVRRTAEWYKNVI